MKKAEKVSLVVALGLLIGGISLLTAGFFANGKSFQTNKEKNVREVQYRADGETVRLLRLELDATEVTVSESGDGDFHAVYRESDRVSFTIEEQDGLLTVREKEKPWWTRIGFSLQAEEHPFLLQIPPAYAGEIDLNVHLGDVTVTGIGTDARFSAELSAGSLQVTDSTFQSLTVRNRLGDVKLSACRMEQGTCELASGSLEAEGLTVEKDLELELSLGDLRLQDSTAGRTVRIESSAGDVTLRNTEVRGSLTAVLSLGNADFRLSGDGYYFTQCETSLGKVKAPVLTGDRVPVRIVNSAGDITVVIG